MKNFWETKRLEEVCEILDSQRKPITKRDRTSGQYPYYGATGIVDYVNDFIFDEPLVLVGEDGAKWGAGENTAFQVTCKCWVNNHAHVLRPDREMVLGSWLTYYLSHTDLSEFVSGLTVPKLNQGSLRGIPVPMPSIYEQKRIVAILDEAFAGIATAKANTEKNLQNARAIFESHLSDIFTKRGEGWVKKTLSDVCEISSTLVDPRENKFLDLPHVGGANIESKTGRLLDLKTAREEGLISGKFLFDEKVVLYSKIRPYLMKVARPNFLGLCSADIYPLSPINGQVDRGYLFHLLLSKDFTEFANTGSARAGMPKVNREHLFAYRTFIPPIAEQRRIAAQLDTLSIETCRLAAIYERKLAGLDELKKSLLHQAFSGEL